MSTASLFQDIAHSAELNKRKVEQYKTVHHSLKTVLTFTIKDAFSLSEDEAAWVRIHLDHKLEDLTVARPRSLPVPVKNELATGIYSKLITNNHLPPAHKDDQTTMQASIQDWARVLADLVTETYTLRPMHDATIVAEFVGILRELGVGNKKNPRASNYLPNSVRYSLRNRK